MSKIKPKVDLTNIQVFHLEDMKPIQEQMLVDLKSIGLTKAPYQAETMQMALKICKEKSDIDLIISDWNLPDKTGMDFLKTLRASKKFQRTPFLMCTTVEEVENIINAINEGANEYIVKPWNTKELQSKIIQILSK